jgi:LPXTG-motif cell wall-anchored protein
MAGWTTDDLGSTQGVRTKARMIGKMRKVTMILTMALVLGVLSLGAVAQAQSTGGDVQPPGIGGETVGRGVSPASEQPSGETLPFTGADLTLFVAIGLGAIGAGGMIVRRTRRANRSEA